MVEFIRSQFSYCPLLCMCHNRQIHTAINRIHERVMQIVYSDNISSFEVLIKRSESVSIHHRKLQLLAMEINPALNYIVILLNVGII